MAKSDVLVRMKADTQNYDANIAKARRQLDQFRRDNLSMGGVMKQLSGSLTATAAQFASIGAAIGAASAAFKSNIETARNFEKSMSQLSSLTGMVGQDLEKLKEYSIELGSSTTLSASQVADAFKLIGSQQPQLLASGEALKAVTKNAITLAEAAGIELADAAKTLSVSINQMGGDSNNAERYINVLAAASQKGAGDIVWLGEAITKSGTTAKAVGTDYEELVANLEQLAKAGYDASTAGTALRSIIMNLEKQANNNFKPSVVGLTQAFENLGKEQMTLTQYQEIAGKMFAAQAKALSDAAGEAKNMTEAITGTNTAEEQAKTNTDNLDGSLKSLASAWEGLNLHINSSNGFLRSCVDWLKDVVTWADQAFTSAGRAQKQLELMRGGGNGQPSNVDTQIDQLGSGNKLQKQITYREQMMSYDQEIKHLRNMASAWNEWRGGNRGADIKKLIDESRDKYNTVSTAALEQAASSLEKLRDEYKSRALQILKKPITVNDSSITSPGGGSGGDNKKKGKTTVQEKTEEQKIQEQINKLIQEYIKLGDEETEAAVERQNQIRTEIELLKERKGLLGIRAEQAQGRLLLKPQNIDTTYNGGFSSTNPFAEDNKATEMTGTLKLQLDKATMNAVNEQILKNIAQDGKAVEESWKKAGNAISGISGALSQIENPAAKIIGTIGQAIATIALAYAETLAQSKEKKNVWAFIATAAAAMVSMASTISSIHSSTGYAEGGIIKGNHYSGDMIGATVDGSGLVGLNAQEVVLNRAQSGVLASQLQGAGSRLNLRGVIRGEDILVAIDRSGQRQGKGELLFWK